MLAICTHAVSIWWTVRRSSISSPTCRASHPKNSAADGWPKRRPVRSNSRWPSRTASRSPTFLFYSYFLTPRIIWVPLSRRTLLSLEVITDPTPALFEVAWDKVMPESPTTPWLVAPRLPAAVAPAMPAEFTVRPAVFTVLPAADPVLLTTPPAVEVTPPRPLRPCIPALPVADDIAPALAPLIMLSVSAAVAAD